MLVNLFFLDHKIIALLDLIKVIQDARNPQLFLCSVISPETLTPITIPRVSTSLLTTTTSLCLQVIVIDFGTALSKVRKFDENPCPKTLRTSFALDQNLAQIRLFLHNSSACYPMLPKHSPGTSRSLVQVNHCVSYTPRISRWGYGSSKDPGPMLLRQCRPLIKDLLD